LFRMTMTRSFALLRTTNKHCPPIPATRSFVILRAVPPPDRARSSVILRPAFWPIAPPEGEDLVDSEGLKPRSFTSFRTTEQGPSRCSGRQSTRGRYHFYVILRSDATKNLTLVFKTLNPGPSPPGMFPPLRSGCSVTAIALFRTTINPRPVPLLCHSEERSDEESDIAFNLSS